MSVQSCVSVQASADIHWSQAPRSQRPSPFVALGKAVAVASAVSPRRTSSSPHGHGSKHLSSPTSPAPVLRQESVGGPCARELSVAAWQAVEDLPTCLDVTILDARCRIISADRQASSATVSFAECSLVRLAAANPPHDGLRFEVSGLELSPDSPAGQGSRPRKGESSKTAGVSVMRRCGMSAALDWKLVSSSGASPAAAAAGITQITVPESQFAPTLHVSGDAVELVLQPAVLLTMMSVLLQLQQLLGAALPSHVHNSAQSRLSEGVVGGDPGMTSLNSLLSYVSENSDGKGSRFRASGKGGHVEGGQEAEWKAKVEELELLLRESRQALLSQPSHAPLASGNVNDHQRVQQQGSNAAKGEFEDAVEDGSSRPPRRSLPLPGASLAGVVVGARAAMGELVGGAKAAVGGMLAVAGARSERETPVQEIGDVEELRRQLGKMRRQRDEALQLVLVQRAHANNSTALLDAARDMLVEVSARLPAEQAAEVGMVEELMADLRHQVDVSHQDLGELEKALAVSNRRATL